MGHRLVLLAALGLGALYMMHLLAMDYMRIRRPATRAITQALFRSKRESNETQLAENKNISEIDIQANWDQILNRDPLNCLQSLVCQIVAGSDQNSTEAIIIKTFIELTFKSTPVKIQSAYNNGLLYQNSQESCYNEYPFCIYSADTMLMILRWFVGNN